MSNNIIISNISKSFQTYCSKLLKYILRMLSFVQNSKYWIKNYKKENLYHISLYKHNVVAELKRSQDFFPERFENCNWYDQLLNYHRLSNGTAVGQEPPVQYLFVFIEYGRLFKDQPSTVGESVETNCPISRKLVRTRLIDHIFWGSAWKFNIPEINILCPDIHKFWVNLRAISKYAKDQSC